MFRFNHHTNYPTFYQRYLERIKDEGFSENKVAFDIETSGLNTKTAELLSFGGIRILDRKIDLKGELYLRFNNVALNDATFIHELLPQVDSKSFTDCLPEIIGFISNQQIVGHFIGFDISLINRELKKLKLPKLKNPSLDTLKLAFKHDGISDLNYASREDYTLYALCERFGIDIDRTHDALEDAYLSALLYLHLVD